ncbi:hypothetical protein JCM21900_006942 [Sporobolomyces salmonicolor]
MPHHQGSPSPAKSNSPPGAPSSAGPAAIMSVVQALNVAIQHGPMITYTYVRCSRSVSYATPDYYADRLSTRAALLLNTRSTTSSRLFQRRKRIGRGDSCSRTIAAIACRSVSIPFPLNIFSKYF